MELAVVGGSEFALGFHLTGIRKVYETDDDPTKKIEEIMKDENVGIVITDAKTMEKTDERVRERAEISVRPVFVVVSTEARQEALRKMILRSIGVDLWSKD